MKKNVAFVSILIVFAICALSAQNANDPAVKPILGHFAARDFAAGAPAKAQLDLVLQAGIRAPSASNRQPWRFTVVQNQDLVKKIVRGASDGNVLIIISTADDDRAEAAMLDCGLAAQSMYLAAQAIGLGSRIYTGPIDAVNKGMKQELGISSDYKAVVLIRVGRLPAGIDAVSSASARNSPDRTITYR
jgi:nitroreductase